MDKRVKDAIEAGRKILESKKMLKEDYDRMNQERYQKLLSDAMPRAEKWVEENVLSKIAEITGEGENRVLIPENIDIPLEAIRYVVSNIHGLYINSQWVEGYINMDAPPEPDTTYYYVCWKK